MKDSSEENIKALNHRADRIAEDILLTYARITKFEEAIKENKKYLQERMLEFVQIRHQIKQGER